MINVFIHHKDKETIKFINDALCKYFKKVRHGYCISGNSNYNETVIYLKKYVKTTDVFFLDFSDFKATYKFALYLRQNNSNAFWVHIGSIDTLLKTLHLRPSAFIDDPENEIRIIETITILDNQYQKVLANTYFSFKYEGEPIRIKYSNIEYFESSAKKVILHLKQSKKVYYFTSKLKDIEQVLPSCFLRCHQSYIVNMDNIKQIDLRNHSFILSSNDEVFISKRMFAQTKKSYNEYANSAEVSLP